MNKSNGELRYNNNASNKIAAEVRNLVPYIHPPVPNPAPLGLYAFGLTTALLQVYHTGIGGESKAELDGTKNLVWGYAIFYGGLLQVIAGLHEVRRNNVLGYTAFLSYGGWWMSVGLANIILILSPNENVTTVGFNPKAMQAMLSLWGMLTFVFWICSFQVNKTICALFFGLMMTFFLLAAGVTNGTVDKIGGWVGIITSLIAFWLASAELVNDIIGKGKEIIPLGQWRWNRFKFTGGFHIPGRIHGVMQNAAIYKSDFGPNRRRSSTTLTPRRASQAPKVHDIHSVNQKLHTASDIEDAKSQSVGVHEIADAPIQPVSGRLSEDVPTASEDVPTEPSEVQDVDLEAQKAV